MKSIKKNLAAMALGYLMLGSISSFATVTNFGDISNSTMSGSFRTVILPNFVLDEPDTFNFTLNSKSDIYINFANLYGINIGDSYFSLKQGLNEISQISLFQVILLNIENYTFDNLASGNYSLSFIPSNIRVMNVGGVVSISANSVVSVPEPETNAMIFLGLGMIGMIARRKFA